MSLDQSLFTLRVIPNTEDPNILDLVDPSGVVHYRKQRLPGSLYEIHVYDPVSESLLITATSPSATSKIKVLQLHNPSNIVELKYVGVVSFRWTFKWEEHEYEWKKEECFMIRKPDPPVLVAISSEPPNRLKTASVQIMDYNLNRFDIEDRKGLEIVILTALLTFQDLNESYHTPRDESGSGETKIPLLGQRKSSGTLPIPPPKPAPRRGVERIAEMHALRGEVNEVTVEEEGEINDYAQHCWNLLRDDAMLFISIRSSAAANVPKVLQIVEETKRIRHKSGSDDDELYQYVVYDQEKSNGPKRINLDDPKNKSTANYVPPTNLTIHLSKIDMPELKPRSVSSSISHKSTKGSKSKERVKEKDNRKRNDSYGPKKGPPPLPSRLTKPAPYPQLVSSPTQVDIPGAYDTPFRPAAHPGASYNPSYLHPGVPSSQPTTQSLAGPPGRPLSPGVVVTGLKEWFTKH